MKLILDIIGAFMEGYRGASLHRSDRDIRSRLSETQLDKMLMDTYPASDATSLY